VIPFVIFLSALLLQKSNLQNRWIVLSVAIPAVVFLLALPAIIYLGSTDEMRYLALPAVYAGAGILTITGLLVIYYLYRKRDTVRSINTLAVGLLLTVFVAGWSMPQLNSYIGWSNLCEKAKEVSEERRIADYWVYHIARAENMDVYLGKDIIKVDKEDIMKQPITNKLLLLPTKNMQNDPEMLAVLRNREQYQIGKYTIVVF